MPGRNTFRDMTDSVPDRRLVEVFQLKYDYHNAKVLIKAQAMGLDEARLLLPGRAVRSPASCGRISFEMTFGTGARCSARRCSGPGRCWPPPEILSRPTWCWTGPAFRRWQSLARACGSAFLQGYVRLSVDAANLRAAVRAARMGKGSEFLNQILLPGGNVSERALAAERDRRNWQSASVAAPWPRRRRWGPARTQPDAGPLTDFERPV